MNSLQEWLAHCERLHPQGISGIAMGLDRVQRVARRMGLTMPCPVVTVAGTNGKGSTCAMLEAVYSEAGYRTGVYTSPHLVRFEERCRIHGVPVAADALLPAFAEVENARQGAGGGPGDQGTVDLTYFEFMDYSAQEPRASKTHQDALSGGQTCIDCHRGIAHGLPPHANEAYQSLVESLRKSGAIR